MTKAAAKKKTHRSGELPGANGEHPGTNGASSVPPANPQADLGMMVRGFAALKSQFLRLSERVTHVEVVKETVGHVQQTVTGLQDQFQLSPEARAELYAIVAELEALEQRLPVAAPTENGHVS